MVGNAVEVAYNFALAHLLRLEGFGAEAEQRVQISNRTAQLDILVEFDDFVAVIEAEFGKVAKADADKRLHKDQAVYIHGLPLRLIVAVGYPAEFSSNPESLAGSVLERTQELSIAYRYEGEEWSAISHCGVSELAETLRNYWVQSDSGIGIDHIVERANTAIWTAGEILEKVTVTQGTLNTDQPATLSLIWLNALLFQELLARHLDISSLPEPYQAQFIVRPDPDGGTTKLLDQWQNILDINWWSIFSVARESLKLVPAPENWNAVKILMHAAAEIAESGAIRRHDVVGRIFHRLLHTRKFLATNYTTIPAAIILSGLALDESFTGWKHLDFSNSKSLTKLRVVDPACGSGTLLMAAVQEIFKYVRRHQSTMDTIRFVLERVIYGFDVVPSAIHLAASTLCMAETRQLIQELNLWYVSHGIVDGLERLGSLDFLPSSPSQGNASTLPLLGYDLVDSTRATGKGEKVERVTMPKDCDLFIVNPPFTRAGGPGDLSHSGWNPIFGSVPNQEEKGRMQRALTRTLAKSGAGVYAGLGSAFVVLADQHTRVGGRIAFVLPSAFLTGSRWTAIRSMILDHYCIEWIVVSHDPRKRSRKRDLPGRYWTSFSESTSMSEVLLIATKDPQNTMTNLVRFVNLRVNPDDPINAMCLVRRLLALRTESSSKRDFQPIAIGGAPMGTVSTIEQKKLSSASWQQSALLQSDLIDLVESIGTGGPLDSIPLVNLSSQFDIGPYHVQIKDSKQGLFDVLKSDDLVSGGFPALWHHDAGKIVTMHVRADSHLFKRTNKNALEQERMIKRRSRLQLALELRSTSQRLSAVITKPMLGIRSWVSLRPREPRVVGIEEVTCLWLNSSLGFLVRYLKSNRSYPGRSALVHELVGPLPILDAKCLSEEQRESARVLYEQLHEKHFMAIKFMDKDPVRKELDKKFLGEILGTSQDVIDSISYRLAREPMIHAEAATAKSQLVSE